MKLKAAAEATWHGAIGRGGSNWGKQYSIFSSEKESLLVLVCDSCSVNNLPEIELVTTTARIALVPGKQSTKHPQHPNCTLCC